MVLQNQSAATQIFLAVSTLCGIWIFFGNDYSMVEIQSPIKIGSVSPAPVSVPASVSAETVANPKKIKVDPLPETENDAAPVSDLPPEDAKSFVKQYAGLAVEEMRRTGIPASITLAQGLVESRAGRSGLALTANNFFGMKCHVAGKCREGHCLNFTDDIETDYFLIFQNAYQSFKAHSELLKKPRYRKCFDQVSYKGWAREIKAAGYATDKNYTQKLISIIERYKLYLLDK